MSPGEKLTQQVLQMQHGSQQYSTIIENEEPLEIDLMLPPRKHHELMPSITMR